MTDQPTQENPESLVPPARRLPAMRWIAEQPFAHPNDITQVNAYNESCECCGVRAGTFRTAVDCMVCDTCVEMLQQIANQASLENTATPNTPNPQEAPQ